jgi:hypothetical protein
VHEAERASRHSAGRNEEREALDAFGVGAFRHLRHADHGGHQSTGGNSASHVLGAFLGDLAGLVHGQRRAATQRDERRDDEQALDVVHHVCSFRILPEGRQANRHDSPANISFLLLLSPHRSVAPRIGAAAPAARHALDAVQAALQGDAVHLMPTPFQISC